MTDALANRLLQWRPFDQLYVAHSQQAVGIVHQAADNRFEWFIFIDKTLTYQGEAKSLHAACAHVEGNFVGRQLLDHQPPSEGTDVRCEEDVSDCAAE